MADSPATAVLAAPAPTARTRSFTLLIGHNRLNTTGYLIFEGATQVGVVDTQTMQITLTRPIGTYVYRAAAYENVGGGVVLYSPFSAPSIVRVQKSGVH